MSSPTGSALELQEHQKHLECCECNVSRVTVTEIRRNCFLQGVYELFTCSIRPHPPGLQSTQIVCSTTERAQEVVVTVPLPGLGIC